MTSNLHSQFSSLHFPFRLAQLQYYLQQSDKMLASMFTVLVLVGACAANPLVVKREEPKEVHCGTTGQSQGISNGD
jgi:hypothetical protein